MQHTAITKQQIIQQIKALPKDSLDDLADYLEFLRFKAQKTQESEATEERLRIV
jgi:hypothetical protein